MKLGFKQALLFGDPGILKSVIEKMVGRQVNTGMVNRFYEAREASLFLKTSEEGYTSINRAGDVHKGMFWPPYVPGKCFVMVYSKSTVHVYVEEERENADSSVLKSRLPF